MLEECDEVGKGGKAWKKRVPWGHFRWGSPKGETLVLKRTDRWQVEKAVLVGVPCNSFRRETEKRERSNCGGEEKEPTKKNMFESISVMRQKRA